MKIGVISSRANSTHAARSGNSEDAAYAKECFDRAICAMTNAGTTNEEITFVSGGGKGFETAAKEYADENLYVCTVIPPRSKVRGAMAFPERNTSIVALSDALVFFWGGEDMYVATAISEAMFMRKPVFLFPI